MSGLQMPRLRFLLALAFAALLHAGYAPEPTTTPAAAMQWVVMAIFVLLMVITSIAIFHAAECSDGRACE